MATGRDKNRNKTAVVTTAKLTSSQGHLLMEQKNQTNGILALRRDIGLKNKGCKAQDSRKQGSSGARMKDEWMQGCNTDSERNDRECPRKSYRSVLRTGTSKASFLGAICSSDGRVKVKIEEAK
jgi:hypothetical protein